MSGFKQVIRSRDDFRALVPEPSELVVAKEIRMLDAHCRSLIALSPFVLVATADRAGRCDVSPRGDAPGFVQVLDDLHLAVPDRPGNKRYDTFENVLENPHVGLLFVIPGLKETLRVNGKAVVTQDEDVLERSVADGKRPLFALGVEVEQAFIHCGKALIRSRLWQPERWPDASGLPSFAKMLLEHAQMNQPQVGQDEAGLQDTIEEAYKTRLY